MSTNSGSAVPNISLDDLVRTVADLLPFRVELDADMSYTGALFIDLGRRGDADDSPDTASIDVEIQPVVWVFDVEGGRETLTSEFGISADPQEVARWISTTAHRVNSPAISRSTIVSPETQVPPAIEQSPRVT